MYSQAPQSGLASLLASRGRGEDTMLVHMTPGEVQALQGIASAAGGSLSVNPQTGLPEAGFLKELLPTIAGGLLKTVFPGMGELGIGLLTAGVSGLLEGDLKKGLVAGMGAYSGAKLTSAISGMGRQEALRRAEANRAVSKTAELGRKEFGLKPVDLNRAASATTLSDLGFVPTKTPFLSPTQLEAPGTFNVRPFSEKLSPVDLSRAGAESVRELATPKRPTLGEFGIGLRSLFSEGGGKDFIDRLGGPEQAGFTFAPVLSALDRAEKQKAQRKFVRLQPPNYYYVPGAFNFESGTFAPGGYYTAPGKPYTPPGGFAEGGVVFQEGGETGTEALEQYYQGLLMPPDTSQGEARRTETLDYINWLNSFLKQPITGAGSSAGDFYTAPTNPPIEDPTGSMPPSGGGPVGGMPPTSEPVVTPPPPSDVPDIDYIPPGQVPVDFIPPQPIINIETEEEPEPESDIIIEAAPEAGVEGVNPFAEDYYRGPITPDDEPEVMPIETTEWANLTPAEKRELGDMPPSDLGQSILEQYQSRLLTEPDLFLQGPSRSEVVDLLKQSPAPDINFGDKESSWKDLASKIGKEAARALVAYQFGVPGALAFDKLFEEKEEPTKEPAAEEPAAEESTGAGGGGGGDGEYFSTFGRDPYGSMYRDIFYGGGGGGRGTITVTQLEDKDPKIDKGNAAGGIISGYNQDLGMANIAPTSPLSFMDTRPVGIAPAPRGLGTEDLRMMKRSAATGYDYNFGFAVGGAVPRMQYAAGGKLLNGPGDGMSDDIKANIDGEQEARLADGEFVVPADVVSHLGNGSTKAGAQKLYAMMDRVRKARTGSTKQGREINPNKFIPA